MEMNGNGNGNQNTGANETNKTNKANKPRRRLNPIVKWVLIGGAVVIVVGGVTWLIVKGKRVPVQSVEQAAEVAANLAAAA